MRMRRALFRCLDGIKVLGGWPPFEFRLLPNLGDAQVDALDAGKLIVDHRLRHLVVADALPRGEHFVGRGSDVLREQTEELA